MCKFSVAVLIVIATVPLGAAPAGELAARGDEHDSAREPRPFVQIYSAQPDRKEIHTIQEPNTVTVTVKVVRILDQGTKLPPNAKVIIEMGPYSSLPVDNYLTCDPPMQTVPLNTKGSITTATFTIHPVLHVKEGGFKTTNGTVIVIASITGATRGIEVREPIDPMDSRVTLKTRDP
jgi:hypothetical protein